MKALEHSTERVDYFRSNELPAIDGHSVMDDTATPQHQGNVEGKPAEKDPLLQEREQQLETWMSDIKSFIRNIDVSKL